MTADPIVPIVLAGAQAAAAQARQAASVLPNGRIRCTHWVPDVRARGRFRHCKRPAVGTDRDGYAKCLQHGGRHDVTFSGGAR